MHREIILPRPSCWAFWYCTHDFSPRTSWLCRYSQWTSITNTPLQTMCLWPMFHLQREKLFSKELEIVPLLFRSPRLKNLFKLTYNHLHWFECLRFSIQHNRNNYTFDELVTFFTLTFPSSINLGALGLWPQCFKKWNSVLHKAPW